jgi:hypothetical protein
LKLVTVVPLGFVTTTSTLPAAWAGVVREIDVSPLDTFRAAPPPNVTVAPWLKPRPLMDTRVPPPVFPELGLIDVIVGSTYWNALKLVTVVPLGFVTTTSTRPAACGGVVALIDVSLKTDTFVAITPAKVTFAP